MSRQAPNSAARAPVGSRTRAFARDRHVPVLVLVLPLALGALFLTMAEFVPEAGSGPSFGQMVVPITLFPAVSSAPLTTATGSLARLRTLDSPRLPDTTPTSRVRLALTRMWTHLGVALGQVTVLIAAATLLGHVSPADLPTLFGISMLGLLMFGAIGYLIGGVARRAESAANTGVYVQMASMFLSFLALPLGMFPDGPTRVIGHLPTSYLADLFFSPTSGWEQLHPTWLSALVVLGTTIVLTALAVRLFRWDQDGRE